MEISYIKNTPRYERLLMNAEIYTKPDCQYCVKAKELFEKQGVSYVEYIISPGFGEKTLSKNQIYVTREMLLEKIPSAKTVPQIWLEGSYIGGYTELDAFFSKK